MIDHTRKEHEAKLVMEKNQNMNVGLKARHWASMCLLTDLHFFGQKTNKPNQGKMDFRDFY